MKRKIFTHAGIVLILIAISSIYFLPILQGKALPQGDLQKYEGMAKAQKDYHQATGEYSTWCPSMFSGMPGYQITNSPQHSLFTPIKDIVTLQFLGRQNDMGILFLYLLGFYIALVALGMSPWMALLGALAFGLGSYNIIIIEAGHITKAWAMALIAPVLAGMLLCLKGANIRNRNKQKSPVVNAQMIWGGILFTLSLGLQIALNHIQITFYTALAGVIMGIVYLIYAIKDRYLPRLLASVGILVVGIGLSLACNTRHLLVNQEYIQYTMRGGSELTANSNPNQSPSGLNIDYAYSWSYGIGETYTLLVPGARGGGSIEPVGKDSQSFKLFRQDKMPLYWGDQPFTSGPVYFGAIIIFLAILGFIIVRGPERWWILIGIIVAILLSWGRNFMPFNQWIFDHLPLYNKFRTPSMSLVLAQVLTVLIALLGLRQIVLNPQDSKYHFIALYISLGSLVVILLGGLITSSSLSFSGMADAEMARQYGSQWPQIQNVLIADRKALFRADTFRSLIFILLAAIVLWFYIRKAEKTFKGPQMALVGVLALLVVIDLQGVDSRYLNKDNYVANARQLALQPAQYDLTIDQYAAQYGDRDYRVFNLAANTFNDSKPSAFHNQVGGYSAAKLRRYQDLIDFYLSRSINPQVLDMLNTRYIVLQDGSVQRNPSALGNCWFVSDILAVSSADDEIQALADFNPATTAVIDTTKFAIPTTHPTPDSTAVIALQHTSPTDLNTLTYQTHSSTPQLAVLSEVYYAPDWRAYIDGKPAEYLRANYILRAIWVPEGDHTIQFRNEAPTLHRLDTITLIASIVTLLILIAVPVVILRRQKKE